MGKVSSVSPYVDGYELSLGFRASEPLVFPFTFSADRLTRSTNRTVLEITIEGRPTAMHVPITLLNGNLDRPSGPEDSDLPESSSSPPFS